MIGPGGKNIKKIIEDTECEVNVDDDGLVTIAGANTEKCNEAVELVKAITFEPEVGMEFDATVTRLMTFGAFVEFVPGREGMVHISELEWHRVEKVEDVLYDHVFNSPHTNFIPQSHELYLDIGAFGTSVMMIEDLSTGINFQTFGYDSIGN